jgi:hypothetical protein
LNPTPEGLTKCDLGLHPQWLPPLQDTSRWQQQKVRVGNRPGTVVSPTYRWQHHALPGQLGATPPNEIGSADIFGSSLHNKPQ